MNKFGKIAEGLASWLIFEQRSGREQLFCEAYLAFPIAQLLQHQYPGRVLSEVEHPVLAPLMRGPGKRPRIDFVVTGEDGKYDIAIETKWVSKSPDLAKDVIKDIIRLDLLKPDYAKESIMVLAGKMKAIVELLRNPRFQYTPDGNDTFLPLDYRRNFSDIRFLPVSQHKQEMFSDILLDSFTGIEISKSIPLTVSGPFPRGATADHCLVYLWKIGKPYNNPNRPKKFKPEDIYTPTKNAAQPALEPTAPSALGCVGDLVSGSSG